MRGISLCLIFVGLQAIKPIVIMFFYKWVSNFHPTIMGDYELYLLTMKHIFAGTMVMSYAIPIIAGELFFLWLPFFIVKRFFSKAAKTVA